VPAALAFVTSPAEKISPAIRPALIRAFRAVCDVTASLAAGTKKKMSDRKRERPGARKGWSNMLIFLVGALGGVLMGGALCVRYLRREMAADIGPRLKRMQLQLDNIETELNIAITTRHAELTACSPGNPYASGQHHHDR
jgi:ferric-dicitrate binding protein FerR (iron transport regulator)